MDGVVAITNIGLLNLLPSFGTFVLTQAHMDAREMDGVVPGPPAEDGGYWAHQYVPNENIHLTSPYV
jgi:hypothetical protein